MYAPVAEEIRKHVRLLGHKGHGVTELRIFDPVAMVTYTDNEDDLVRLCLEMQGKASGIYIGVQPRPVHLFDLASNRWVLARGGPEGNCARDSDIEYITTVFFDFDVVCEARAKGYPASEEELQRTLQAARLLSEQEGLAGILTISCTGNGHQVFAPCIPIPVDCDVVGMKFKAFCQDLAARTDGRVEGVRIDLVSNLSRVCRVVGTWNFKGIASADRPHRRAYFVTEPIVERSIALHHMILNMEVGRPAQTQHGLPTGLRCNLARIEGCEFIRWFRANSSAIGEPSWWALITNLAHLEGGIELAHEISRLDTVRYDYADTQRKIQKAIDAGYKPVSCKKLVSESMACPGRGRFQCSRIGKCPARAPMYLATSFTVYQR